METRNTADRLHGWLSDVIKEREARKEAKQTDRRTLEERVNSYGKGMSTDTGVRIGVIATLIALIIAVISSIRTVTLFMN